MCLGYLSDRDLPVFLTKIRNRFTDLAVFKENVIPENEKVEASFATSQHYYVRKESFYLKTFEKLGLKLRYGHTFHPQKKFDVQVLFVLYRERSSHYQLRSGFRRVEEVGNSE